MSEQVWIVVSIAVFIGAAASFYFGYEAGVADTEVRWSEAVARAAEDARRSRR